MATESYSDPVSLVQAVVASQRRSDWEGVAALCDPASVEHFASEIVGDLDPERVPQAPTAEDYRRQNPEMPAEVAQYFVDHQAKFRSTDFRLRFELDGIEDLDQLRAAHPRDVLGAWLRAKDPTRATDVLVSEGQIGPEAAQAALKEAGGVLFPEPLGSVKAGEELAFVVCQVMPAEEDRETLEQWVAGLPEGRREFARTMVHGGQAQLATCRRQEDGGWRLVVDRLFLGPRWGRAVGVVGPKRGERPVTGGSA